MRPACPAVRIARAAFRVVLGSTIACATFAPAFPGPSLNLVERDNVVLRVRTMNATAVEPPRDGAWRLDVGSESKHAATIRLRWPAESDTTVVRLDSALRPPVHGHEHVVHLSAAVELPDGRRTEATRDLAFNETTTGLFEIARFDGRALTLVIEAESVTETVYSSRPQVGDPVLFLLEVQWLEGGHGASLETNQMHTFVGQTVSYSFDLGQTELAEAIRIGLTPLRLYNDVLQIEMEIAGKLPEGDGMMLISRTEQWLSSRDQSSTVDVVAGEPPTGFRFIVTPRF